MEYSAIHLWLNAYHAPWLDCAMRGWTTLAEWPLYVLALLPLLWRRWRPTALFAAAELLSAAFVQTIKHLVAAPRPATYFAALGGEAEAAFREILVPGVRMAHSYSFPSGHTATFFCFATLGWLLYRERGHHPYIMAFALLLFAMIGGYSRIYLSQHFLQDVVVGALIGSLAAVVVYAIERHKYYNFHKKGH